MKFGEPHRKSNHRTKRSAAASTKPADVPGARRAALPKHPQAQLATLVSDPPEGDDWLHEMKFDGYRMLCTIRPDAVNFVSRNGQDWTARMQSLVEPAKKLKIETAVLDGEVVVLDKKGISHFQSLQNAFRGEGRAPLVYFVFDLLYLDGFDLTQAKLEDRKALLKHVLSRSPPVVTRLIRFSDHVIGSGRAFKRKMCAAGLEGMISKRRDAPYVAGRGGSWQKSKCRQGQELVIGGYTRPSGSRVGFGALLLGYFRPDGKLVYAGRVGTGFNDKLLGDLLRKLARIRQPKSPFVQLPFGTRQSDVTWVRPKLVAQIEFSNWTDEGLLRQAVFQGLREDKPATAVRREKPKSKV